MYDSIRRGPWCEAECRRDLVQASAGSGTAIRIRNRYAALHVARPGPGESVTIPDAPFAHVYLARGRMELESEGALDAGDAARLTAAGERRLTAAEPSEVLIWEMHAGLGPAAR